MKNVKEDGEQSLSRIQRVWKRIVTLLDIAGVFALAMAALTIRFVRMTILLLAKKNEGDGVSRAPRRVVFFIPSLGLGGAQRQLVTLLKYIDRTQWDPQVVTLNKPDKFFEEQVRALTGQIEYLNDDGQEYMLKVVLVWRLTRFLQRNPCYLLHGWMHYAMALGSIAGTFAGGIVIFGSIRSGRPSRFPLHFPRWQRWIDLLTAPLHKHLIANSHAVKIDHMQSAFLSEKKLSVIYNGIDVDVEESESTDRHLNQRRAPRDQGYPPVVGIVGRLWPEKDHRTFLQVASRISQECTGVKFLIVGEGPLREKIEAEGRHLGLSEHIEFLKNQRDILSVMRKMDVLLLTSIHEGFPNVLLEAAVAGTPVVTTEAGGAQEFVVNGETGFVVKSGDVEALAEKTLRLLGDHELGISMARLSFDRVKKFFSGSVLVQRLEHLYEQSIQQPKSLGFNKLPMHVCFISPNAYDLFWPKCRMSFGGAEVQMYTLMRGLSRIPGYVVSLLTRGGEVLTQGQQWNILIYRHALLGKPKGANLEESNVRSNETKEGSYSGSPWEEYADRSKTWLDSKPPLMQENIRACIRTLYSIRRLIMAWPVVAWGLKARLEGKEIFKWVRVLRNVDADIYVVRCASPMVGYVSAACRLLRKKFVYMIAHDIDVSGEYVQAHKGDGQWYEYGFRYADARICQHSKQVQMVHNRYKESATLIRSLCPTSVSENIDRIRTSVLWIARVDSWKQPTLFVDLAKDLPTLHFVMVAAPSEIEPNNLSMIHEQARGVSNLCILGSMSLEESNALFDEAMIFINTSQAEGFPNTFLQAAAKGVPIVSLTVNPDGVLDSYHLGYCANGDWDKFTGDIFSLSVDHTLRIQMGDNGRRYIRENHDPPTIVGQYAELFNTCMHL